MIRNFEKTKPQIAANVYVDPAAVIIGNVTIEEGSSVWPTAVIRGDVNAIHIGKRCSVQDGTVIHVSHAGPFNPTGDTVMIGDDVTIGHCALIHAACIGDRCLIGMGARILDRAVVEPDVMVGAGSLVTPGKVLESGYLWMGSPARKIRKLTTEEKEKIMYSAQYYSELGQRHRPT